MSVQQANNDGEEMELGIYEDKGSGTDLSDGEMATNQEISRLDIDAVAANTTPTPRVHADTEDGEKIQPLHSNIPPPQADPITPEPVANKTTDENNNTIDKLHHTNSVDPALEIRGILKTPSGRNSLAPSPTKSVAGIRDSPAIEVTGPPPSASKELLSAVKGINYIEQKCVGTDTRRKSSSYNFRESPTLKAATSAQSRNVYIYQNRPSPMVPLKAWKGYSGNIYFDPIKIRRVSSANGVIETVSRSQSGNVTADNSAKQSRLKTAKPDLSSLAFHCEIPPKPAIIMDKQAVMDKQNKDMQEDLDWIRSTEDVGSLKIERGPGDSRTKEKKLDYRSLRKGSVAHELAKQKKRTSQPVRSNKRGFAISGDRYTAPSYMSPLLRSSTQYTQSTHRPVSSTPDLSRHSASLDRLPPVEQRRASIRGNKEPKTSTSKRVQIVTDEKIPSYIKLNKTDNNGNFLMQPVAT